MGARRCALAKLPPLRVALRRLHPPRDALRFYPPGVVVASSAVVLDALLRSGALPANHPMAERVQVFGRVVSGADPGWHKTESLLKLERYKEYRKNVYGAGGGRGSSSLDYRCQPTLQTILETNDVQPADTMRRRERIKSLSRAGPYPNELLEAYQELFEARDGVVTIGLPGDNVRVAAAVVMADGVPLTPSVGEVPAPSDWTKERRAKEPVLCVGFVPPVPAPEIIQFAKAAEKDPGAAMEELL